MGVSQNLTQRTTSRCVRQVVDALNHPTLMSKWIQFPQTVQERSLIKEEFQKKYNLPVVIGCIDCTHIAIVKPAEEEHAFYNRKGYHSLNVQIKLKNSCLGVKLGDIKVNCLLYADDAVLIAPSEAELQALVTCMKEECEIKGLRLNANKTKVLVFERDEERTKCEIWVNQECLEQVCDHNLKIININAKFGGATHDSHIWSSSLVEPYMRHLHESGEHVWLLGDSGYPQRPWLMTPILNAPHGSREKLYTTRHVQARTCIERCFGLLKTRWRCLLRDRVLHYHPNVASKITLACCVLHNISLHAHLPAPSDIPVTTVDHNDDSSTQTTQSTTTENRNELIRGRAMLNYLISRL
ncbi:unnamed protein product [Parnassius mnemosyne]|uniref:DDE Tnp4 domain-containing protein n=1 Tax=Parnassius mnemosyne TaxID=213953 RepID=A0AAV1LB40_9NEOP